MLNVREKTPYFCSIRMSSQENEVSAQTISKLAENDIGPSREG